MKKLLRGAAVATTGWIAGTELAQAVTSVELCRAERAIYTLKSDPAFTAGFIPAEHFASMASNLYLWVKSPQRTYYFVLTTGNGYTGISLGPIGRGRRRPQQRSGRIQGRGGFRPLHAHLSHAP